MDAILPTKSNRPSHDVVATAGVQQAKLRPPQGSNSPTSQANKKAILKSDANTECGQCEIQPLRALTERETQLLRFVALGPNDKQLARHFGLSIRTAQAHVKNAVRKLQACNRPHAVAIALQLGVVVLRAPTLPRATQPFLSRNKPWQGHCRRQSPAIAK